jgi:hypothetical protein
MRRRKQETRKDGGGAACKKTEDEAHQATERSLLSARAKRPLLLLPLREQLYFFSRTKTKTRMSKIKTNRTYSVVKNLNENVSTQLADSI